MIEDFNTLDEKGNPPKTRLGSARTAQSLFFLWKQAYEARRSKAATIQGMFDGNPPYRRDKRRVNAQDYRANFNTLEGTSRKDAAKTPYYDLLASTKTYYDARTKKDNPKGLKADAASRCITEEFDAMIKRWKAFEFNFWTMLDDFIKWNMGFFWWPKEDSWRFRRVPWKCIYFPDGYDIDTEEWEEFAIEHTWKVTKLWELIRDEGDPGWNKEAVIEAIRKAVPAWKEDEPMEIQRRLNDNTFEPNAMAATVEAASVFYREYNGKWSRMMVCTAKDLKSLPSAKSRAERYQYDDEDNSKMKDTDWLYRRLDITENLEELLAPFIFEAGDGSITALEGLGKKIISMMQAKDRMACGLADTAISRQNIFIQGTSPSSSPKAGLIQMSGGIGYIPAGYNVITGQLPGDIDSALAVSTDFDRRLDTNTGIYRPQFEKPKGNPETATAANIRFTQATILTNSAVNRFQSQLDPLGCEMFRRAMKKDLPDIDEPGIKAAKELQKTLKDKGVSREQIDDVIKRKAVRSVRTIGNGSAIKRIQDLQTISGIVPTLGPRGKEKFNELLLSAVGGQDFVQSLMPEEDRMKIPTQDDWEASRENNDMQQGAPPLLAEGQDHEVHAARHIAAGMASIQAVMNGAEPTSAFIFLQLAIPHTMQHAQNVSEEERKQIEQGVKQLEQGFKEVQKVAQQIRQQQAQQSQQGPQMDFEQRMKAVQAKGDFDLKNAQAQAEIELKKQKAQVDMEIDKAKAQNDIQLRRAQMQANIQEDLATREQ